MDNGLDKIGTLPEDCLDPGRSFGSLAARLVVGDALGCSKLLASRLGLGHLRSWATGAVALRPFALPGAVVLTFAIRKSSSDLPAASAWRIRPRASARWQLRELLMRNMLGTKQLVRARIGDYWTP